MKNEMPNFVEHRSESVSRPGKVRRIASKTGNLLRIASGDFFVNWLKIQDARMAKMPARYEWLNARASQLAAIMKTEDPNSAWILAYERACLELFCTEREALPVKGLNIEKMRWLGFRINSSAIDLRPGMEASLPATVSAIFPEGWDMRPTHDEDDPAGAIFAVITDPNNNARFKVTYKEAPYEFRAWIHEVNT